MPWLNHPKFRKVREKTLTAISREEYRFRHLKKVIFLCGGRQSRRRERVREYLLKNDLLVFYAEDVWSAIAQLEKLSALEMEARLAELADLIIIIVESPGTFAELGAFSLSDKLRKKLLPLMDARYRKDESFLNTGPIKWVDSESDFAPTIWTNLEAILECAAEVDSRIERISPVVTRVKDLSNSPKHLVFFICDLISIFGPCPIRHIEFYVERIVGKNLGLLALYLELAGAMGLVRASKSERGDILYHRPLHDGKLLPFHYTKKHLGIPQLHAEVLSVMQVIETSKAALLSVRRQ